MTNDVVLTTLRRIERTIRKLPRHPRDAFRAVRIDDLSYVETAQRTGVTVSEVEQLFAEALFNITRHVDRPRRWRRIC